MLLRKNRIIYLSALLCLAFNTGCDKEKVVTKEIFRPVRYTTVAAGRRSDIKSFTGQTRSSEELKLSFNVSGTMAQLNVKVGDTVQKGKILAKLDIKDYLPDVQSAEASLNDVLAQARNVKANYNRVRALYETGSASAEQLDAAKATFESSEANVVSARKQLEMARLRYSYTSMIAPKAGVVTGVQGEVNENVTQGVPVVILDAGDRFDAVIEIPEKYISAIRKGQRIELCFASISEQSFPASVTEVGLAPDRSTTTYHIVAQLSDSDPRIRAGMALEAKFDFAEGNSRDLVLLPSAAVGEDNSGRFVFTLQNVSDNFGSVKRTQVTIGDLSSEGIEIMSGLSEGDRVITAGVSLIKDGQKVKVPPLSGDQK